MFSFKYILVILIIIFNFLKAQQTTEIYINEFLASNVSIDADIVDFDDYSDWIELYNAEDMDVDIIGYFISDDPDNPFKWPFSESTIIPAKGFLRVWADGNDVNPGKTRTRPYRNQSGDPIYFTTKYHHLNFNLSRAGEMITLYNPDSTLVDSVTFALQQRDVSMGRKPDGSPNWFFFGEPTAADSNKTAAVLNIEYAESPEISLQSGFYSSSQLITINALSPGAQIRYTLNGDKPSSLSMLYESPINIDQTTVLRIRIFEDDKLPGPVITKTYFINENISVPVIAITSPPAALFDNKIGIYDNIFKGMEIPVHFEFFESNGLSELSLDAGLRLSGQLSIFYAQKSFTIEARERYGSDVFDYQIFPQRKIDNFSTLYLRNSGLPDNQSTFFRDALIQSLAFNKIDIDAQAYRPSVVFLNGQYWGIYNIREKINTDYIGSLHNINPDDIDLLEYNGNRTAEVMDGQADNYNAFYDYINSNDLSRDENYSYISTWMDIDEYINYQICEIFADNIIWLDQNVRMWRERKEDAKWRWLLFDTDYGFGMPNPLSTGYTNNTLQFATNPQSGNMAPPWATLILRKLLKNDAFRTKFIQRFAVYLNTIFYPDSVLAITNQLQNILSPEMSRHISRWRYDDYGRPIQSYGEWLDNVNVMKTFAINRPRYQRQHIVDYFGLSGTYQLTLDINDADRGRIKVNESNWTNYAEASIFFKDIALQLEAIPEVGYRFVGWQGIVDSLENPVSVLPAADTLTVKALFEPISVNLIPSVISVDSTLSVSNSPFYASSNVTIDSNVTLQIDEGVEILMAENTSIIVNGRFLCSGTSENPVIIRPNEYSESWGAFCFVNATDSSVLSNLEISGATKGVDFSRDKAAISAYNSRLALNNVTIKNSKAPVFVQFGKIVINTCNLASDIAGDLINIKYADNALVENCILQGNDAFDSDAVDFDQLENGIIRDNRIYNFYGYNSDAIDLGEKATNILVENNIIYNIDDKGISIGGGSTAIIRRNVIANCGQGSGIKDYGSYGNFEHNTFYGNNYGIASFVKNIGRGGGNADVVNCVFANSKTSSFYKDGLSELNISYSLSNTEEIPGLYNTFDEPGFLNDLHLSKVSPAIDHGNPTLPLDPDGSLADLGAFPFDADFQGHILINEIHYNPLQGTDYEFIEIANSSDTEINLGDFEISGDIHFTFPEFRLSAREFVVIAKNLAHYPEVGNILQWADGELVDGAGSLYVKDSEGNVIDFINYENKYWWPKAADGSGPSLELLSTSFENMTSGSWRSSFQDGGTPGQSNNSSAVSGIFINEFLASNIAVNKDENDEYDDWIELYNGTDNPINLAGFFITDKYDNPVKFLIPANIAEQTTIPAKGHLLLWADEQGSQGGLHLNFKLNKNGEQIGLLQITDSDTIFVDSISFGIQSDDVSYGRFPDGSANWQFFQNPTPRVSNVLTTIEKKPVIPLKFSLKQNYPNPFNPNTVISYQLPMNSRVELFIYNILGQKVATLVNKNQTPGSYQMQWDASGFASGIYFYSLIAKGKTDNFARIKKMLLLK